MFVIFIFTSLHLTAFQVDNDRRHKHQLRLRFGEGPHRGLAVGGSCVLMKSERTEKAEQTAC